MGVMIDGGDVKNYLLLGLLLGYVDGNIINRICGQYKQCRCIVQTGTQGHESVDVKLILQFSYFSALDNILEHQQRS